MSWYKATLYARDGSIALQTNAVAQRFLQRTPSAALMQRPIDDMALIVSEDPHGPEAVVYFTPACHPHYASLIAELGAEKCDPPGSSDGLAQLQGPADWRERFFHDQG